MTSNSNIYHSDYRNSDIGQNAGNREFKNFLVDAFHDRTAKINIYSGGHEQKNRKMLVTPFKMMRSRAFSPVFALDQFIEPIEPKDAADLDSTGISTLNPPSSVTAVIVAVPSDTP